MNFLRSLDIIIVLLGIITICVVISTVFERRWSATDTRGVLTRFLWIEDQTKHSSFPIKIASTTLEPIVEDDDKGCPNIITRANWNAQPPTNILQNITLPVSYAIISHTASEECSTQTACTLRVRLMQTLHIEAFGWDDIGYSFLIGGDGNVYQGRGWGMAGAFAFGWNDKSLGISFIGTFNNATPSDKMMSTARKLLNCGKAGGFLSNDFKVLGHRQVSQTLSPGDKLYALIKKWPEWLANPPQ